MHRSILFLAAALPLAGCLAPPHRAAQSVRRVGPSFATPQYSGWQAGGDGAEASRLQSQLAATSADAQRLAYENDALRREVAALGEARRHAEAELQKSLDKVRDASTDLVRQRLEHHNEIMKEKAAYEAEIDRINCLHMELQQEIEEKAPLVEEAAAGGAARNPLRLILSPFKFAFKTVPCAVAGAAAAPFVWTAAKLKREKDAPTEEQSEGEEEDGAPDADVDVLLTSPQAA